MNVAPNSTIEPTEFASKYFGKQQTLLFVLRSIAIWIFVVVPAVLMVTKLVVHNQPPGIGYVAGFVAIFVAAIVLQNLAVRSSWKTVDARRILWVPAEGRLHIFEHRVTKSLLSFGTVVPELVLPLDEILSHKVVKGRGRFLRLQTEQGFVEISNDILEFDALCAIVADRSNA